MAGDRFLSRWSRRKAKVRRAAAGSYSTQPRTGSAIEVSSETVADTVPEVCSEDPGAEAVVPAASTPDSYPTEETALSDEDLAAKAEELGLPALDSLGPGSDFSGFMASEVPDRLRSMALRRLWRSNPILANVDGLVDYGEDFTDAATVVENLQTAYRVGSGYRRDEEDAVNEEEENGEEDGGVDTDAIDRTDPDEAVAAEDFNSDADENPDAVSDNPSDDRKARDGGDDSKIPPERE